MGILFILQVSDKMGNQQSSTSPPVPSSPPPPPAPVCDSKCQKQKMLDGLKLTLDQKEETQKSDPEGYEQARLAYYTAVNGQGWLSGEKNRIATDEIEPVVSKYTSEYNTLKDQLKKNSVFSNLASTLQAEQQGDEEDVHFLKKQFQKEKDQANVLNRLSTLSNAPVQSNYLPILADIGITILAMFVLYMIYSKFTIIKGYFGYGAQPVPMGGKRLP